MITSSISPGSSCGVLASTSLMQCAIRSSGRVRLNDPRNDLASGVRALATTTASLILDSLSCQYRERWRVLFIERSSAGPRSRLLAVLTQSQFLWFNGERRFD